MRCFLHSAGGQRTVRSQFREAHVGGLLFLVLQLETVLRLGTEAGRLAKSSCAVCRGKQGKGGTGPGRGGPEFEFQLQL